MKNKLIFGSVVLVFICFCLFFLNRPKENTTLIWASEGYEGSVIVFFDQKDRNELIRKGKFTNLYVFDSVQVVVTSSSKKEFENELVFLSRESMEEIDRISSVNNLRRLFTPEFKEIVIDPAFKPVNYFTLFISGECYELGDATLAKKLALHQTVIDSLVNVYEKITVQDPELFLNALNDQKILE